MPDKKISRRSSIEAGLFSIGAAVGSVDRTSGWLSTLAAIGLKTIGNNNDLMNSLALGMGSTGVARLLSGCGSTGQENIMLPTTDLSGDKGPQENLLPYAAAFIPISSAAEYEKAFWNRLDGCDFFENNNYTPAYIDQWRSDNNVDAINQSILNDFLHGRSVNPNNDFLLPDNWQNITSTLNADPAEHWGLLKTIGEQGLDRDVRILNYVTDTGQRPDSNIIRQVFMVDYNDKRYFIKVQNINDALNEAGAVINLEIESPSTRVSNMSIFKLSKSPVNKVTITVSDAIEQSPGVPAATLEEYLASNTLTDIQRQQLLEIYRTGVKSIANQNDPLMFHSDLLKLQNIVVDPADGSLVVVDAFSSEQLTQVVNDQGLIRAVNSSAQSHLLTMRNQLLTAGVTQDEILGIEQELMSSDAISLSNLIGQGQTALVNVVSEAGDVAAIQIENDLGAKPIIVPKTIPWEKLTAGLNIAISVLGGIMLGSEIANKFLSADERYEVPIPEIDDHIRRNMPDSLFFNVYGDGRNVNIPYLLGHTTYVADVDYLKKMIERHRWVMNLREGFNLPTGYSQLQLILTKLGPGFSEPDALDVRADIVTDVTGDIPLETLDIRAKSPLIKIENNEKLMDLIDSLMTDSMIDPGVTQILQRQFDDLDQVLSDEINIKWGTGQKWHVLEILQKLYDEKMINFWTISNSGHVVYAFQTGENIEFRYLAYEDNSKPSYTGTDGKVHFPKKAVTINELAKM